MTRSRAACSTALCILALVGSAWGYNFDAPPVTTDPSVTLTTYNGGHTNNDLRGKGRMGLCQQVAYPSIEDYEIKLFRGDEKIYDSADTPTTMSELVNLTAQAWLLEGSNFMCVRWEDPEGFVVPSKGELTAEVRIPSKTDRLTAGDDGWVVLKHSFDVTGRKGPQTVSFGRSIEPELVTLEDGAHDLHVYGDTCRFYMVPENGIKRTMYNMYEGGRPRVTMVEFMAAFTDLPVATVPSIKELGYNYVKVLLPKQLGHRHLKQWHLRYALANSGLMSPQMDAEPGKEVVIDGLSPSTNYMFEINGEFVETVGGETDHWTLQATTNAHPGGAGEVKWKSIGMPAAFRKSLGSLSVSIPSRLVRDGPRVEQVDMYFYDLETDKVFKNVTTKTSGVITVPGVNVRNGFKVIFTITDEFGFKTEHKELMRVFDPYAPPEPNTLPYIQGDPVVIRSAANSLLLRIPKRLDGFGDEVSKVDVFVRDALSLENLFQTTVRNSGDTFLASLPFAPSGVYTVRMDVHGHTNRNPPTVFHAAVGDPTKLSNNPPIPAIGLPTARALRGKVAFQAPANLPKAYGGHRVKNVLATVTDATTNERYEQRFVGAGGGGMIADLPSNTSLRVRMDVNTFSSSSQPQLVLHQYIHRNPFLTPPPMTQHGKPHFVSFSAVRALLRVPPKEHDKDITLVSNVTAEVVSFAFGDEEVISTQEFVGCGDLLLTGLPDHTMWAINLNITRITPPANTESTVSYTLLRPVVEGLGLSTSTPAGELTIRTWTELVPPNPLAKLLSTQPEWKPPRRVVAIRVPPTTRTGHATVVIKATEVLPAATPEPAASANDACRCVDGGNDAVIGVYPLCGVDQIMPPCSSGVPLMCPSPLRVDCPENAMLNAPPPRPHRLNTNNTIHVPLDEYELLRERVSLSSAADLIREIPLSANRTLSAVVVYPDGTQRTIQLDTPAAAWKSRVQDGGVDRSGQVEVVPAPGGVVVAVPRVLAEDFVAVLDARAEVRLANNTKEVVRVVNLTAGAATPIDLPRAEMTEVRIAVNGEQLYTVLHPRSEYYDLPLLGTVMADSDADLMPLPPVFPSQTAQLPASPNHGLIARLSGNVTSADVQVVDSVTQDRLFSSHNPGSGDFAIELPKYVASGVFKAELTIERPAADEHREVTIVDQDQLDSGATAVRLPLPSHGMPSVHYAEGLAVYIRVPSRLDSSENSKKCEAAAARVRLYKRLAPPPTPTPPPHPVNASRAVVRAVARAVAANAAAEEDLTVPLDCGRDNLVALPVGATDFAWAARVEVDVEFAGDVKLFDDDTNGTAVATISGSTGRVTSIDNRLGTPQLSPAKSGVTRLSCPSKLATTSLNVYSCDFKIKDVTDPGAEPLTRNLLGGQRDFVVLGVGHTYKAETVATMVDGARPVFTQVIPFRITASGLPVPAQGPLQVLPACPHVLVRVPRTLLGDDGTPRECESNNLVATIADDKGLIALNEAPVDFGTDVALTPKYGACCDQPCEVRLRCVSKTGQRETLAETAFRPPPESAIVDPAAPMIYTHNCSAFELHNNVWNMTTHYTIATLDGDVVHAGSMTRKGKRTLGNLGSATNYRVTLNYTRTDEDGARAMRWSEVLKTDMCGGIAGNGYDETTHALSTISDYSGQEPSMSVSSGRYSIVADCPQAFQGIATAHCALTVTRTSDGEVVGKKKVNNPNEQDHVLSIGVEGHLYTAPQDHVIDYAGTGDLVTDPEAPRTLPSQNLLGEGGGSPVKTSGPKSGMYKAEVVITNHDGRTHTLTSYVDPSHYLPRDPLSIPRVLRKNHKQVEMQMQLQLLELPFNFMRVVYEELPERVPRMVYPYKLNLYGGEGDLTLDHLYMDVRPSKRYRLVTMLRNEDGDYENMCIFFTANADPDVIPRNITVMQVTTQEVHIFLPRLLGVTGYKITSIDYDDTGMEHRTILFDGELTSLRNFKGHYMYVRKGLSPGVEYAFSITTQYGGDKADVISELTAITDTDAFPCLPGRPTRAQKPASMAGSITSRGFTVEFPPVVTSEIPKTYPVQNYTLKMRNLGYCTGVGEGCMYPDAPWDEIAQQIPVEDIAEGTVQVEGLSAAGSSWVHTSCSEVSASGWYDIQPSTYDGEPFQVYCQVREDGAWAKVMQFDLQYRMNTGNISELQTPGKVNRNAKYDDNMINALAGNGTERVFRLDYGRSRMSMFLKTQARYQDDKRAFGFLEGHFMQSTSVGMGLHLGNVPHWNHFDYRYIDTQFTHPKPVSTVDECERLIMGKETFDCYKKANSSVNYPVRCLNGGEHCEDFMALPNVEMFVFHGEGCPNHCNERGKCVDGVCDCDAGWTGRACDVAEEAGSATGHHLVQSNGVRRALDGRLVRQPSSFLELSSHLTAGHLLEIGVPYGGIPGYQYVVAIVGFNDWGESDMGIVSDPIRLNNEPPEVIDIPWFTNVEAGSPRIRPSSVDMHWRVPYHNGAPIESYEVECNPPPPAANDDETLEYPGPIGHSYKSVFKGPAETHEGHAKVTLGTDETALVPAQRYACRVRACNSGPGGGCGGWSEPGHFRTKNERPERVTGVMVTDVTTEFATLIWTKPRHNGNPISYYQVLYRTYELLPPPPGSACGAQYGYTPIKAQPNCSFVEGLTCTVPGVRPGIAYYYYVRAVNCDGPGPKSQAVAVRVPGNLPDAPKELTAAHISYDTVEFEMYKGDKDNGAELTKWSVECDDDTNAAHCLSGGPHIQPGNLEAEPWCMPRENSDAFEEKGNVTKAEYDATYTCSDPPDQRVIRIRVHNLRPATTYRCRAVTHSVDGFSEPAVDPFTGRSYIVVRTRDHVPESASPVKAEPVVNRVGFEDEFKEQWTGLCRTGTTLVNCECEEMQDSATLEQCKQACRNTPNCTAMSHKQNGGSKNCILYTTTPTPYSPSNMQDYKCYSHHPVEMTGSFVTEDNSYALTLSWGHVDPNGRNITEFRIYRQNVTRQWSSSQPQLTRTLDNQVDVERLSALTNIPVIEYQMVQFPELIGETKAHRFNVGRLAPDMQFNFYIAGVNALGQSPITHATPIPIITGPGRPSAPPAPTIINKAGFWMRVGCPPSRGLDGGTTITSMTLQMMKGEAANPPFLDWSNAQEHTYQMGEQFEFGEMAPDMGVIVGCPNAGVTSTDPLSTCLELGGKYQYRCKVENKIGESPWSDSASFSTTGGPPDTLSPQMLHRDHDPALWYSGTGVKVTIDMPNSNGLPLTFCQLEIGGSWNDDIPAITEGSCEADICPTVRKKYQRPAPSFNLGEENMPGYKFYRFYSHSTLNGTRWCVGNLTLFDKAGNRMVPDKCFASSAVGSAQVLCTGAGQYCSDGGMSEGWLELAMKFPVEIATYSVQAGYMPEQAPTHFDLRGSRKRQYWDIFNTHRKTDWQAGETVDFDLGEKQEPEYTLKLVSVGGNSTEFMAVANDDGWVLVLSYTHNLTDATRPLSPRKLPISPDDGHSHSYLGMFGVKASQIEAVRFECSSSKHPRKVAFENSNEGVGALIIRDGGNTSVADLWNSAGITKLAAHTATLPDGATSFRQSMLNHPFASDTARWSLGTEGKWECDDMAPANATHATSDTVHRVWAKLSNATIRAWQGVGVGCFAKDIDGIDFNQWTITPPNSETTNTPSKDGKSSVVTANFPIVSGMGALQEGIILEAGESYVVSITAQTNKSNANLFVKEGDNELASITIQESGRTQMKTFSPVSDNVTLGVVFFGNNVEHADAITITSLSLTKQCVEGDGIAGGLYISPNACQKWARLFTTKAEDNFNIPKRTMVANVYALGSRVLKITEKEDGEGEAVFIRDPLPSFIVDPNYTPANEYHSMDKGKVMCTTTARWAGPWEDAAFTSPTSKAVATPAWSLWKQGVTTTASSSVEHPCGTEGPVNTFWMCADKATDVDSEDVADECIKGNSVTFFSEDKTICAGHGSWVTITGQACPGSSGKVQWNSIEVVDPDPECPEYPGVFRRSERLGEHAWLAMYLGSAPNQECGTKPANFPKLPDTLCGSLDKSALTIQYEIPDTSGEAGQECKGVCRVGSDPECVDVCDDRTNSLQLLPSAGYYFRAACTSTAGAGDWSSWQRWMSSVGAPTVPRLFEIADEPEASRIAIKWERPARVNGAPIQRYEVMRQCVSGMGCAQLPPGEPQPWEPACSAKCELNPVACLDCAAECLLPKTTYNFKIRCTNGGRFSEYSNIITATTPPGRPTQVLSVDDTRGSAGDGRFLPELTRLKLSEILEASPTCDYSQVEVPTQPLTSDLQLPTQGSNIAGCEVDPDTYELSVTWVVPESNMGSPITEYVISVASLEDSTHIEGSPFTVLNTNNDMYVTATLARIPPAVPVSVSAMSRNAYGLSTVSTHLCTVQAPRRAPCWDGWDKDAVACLPLSQNSTPQWIETRPWEITFGFEPPAAQNGGDVEKNFYQVQWAQAEASVQEMNLCLNPDYQGSEACQPMGLLEMTAGDVPMEDNKYIIKLGEEEGIEVPQGSVDGRAYKARVRVREQCRPTRPRYLQVSLLSGTDYDCQIVEKGLNINERVYTDRFSYKFYSVPDDYDPNFKRNFLVKCPWTKAPGGRIRLQASQPVHVYAATRMNAQTGEAQCEEFMHTGFQHDPTANVQVVSSDVILPYAMHKRTYEAGTIEFTYNTSHVEQLPTGCSADDGAFSFFVVTPVRGQAACPWTPWTLPSLELDAASRCEYTAQGKCGGHGTCNETTGECECHKPQAGQPVYGGTDCGTEMTDAMCKCVGDPHCTTPDGHYFDYYGGGEYSLYTTQLRPNETIHVVLNKVNHVTAIGKVAFQYKDRVITVESHPPENPIGHGGDDHEQQEAGRCPTIRVNCQKQTVRESPLLNPTFSVRKWDDVFGEDEPLEIVTENEDGTRRFCDGNEGEFTIINHATDTRLYCRRWGGKWAFNFHCYLTYMRNIDPEEAHAEEGGLCSYTGDRDAEFRATKWEDLIRVKRDQSLFTNSRNEYCVDTQSYCHNKMTWAHGGTNKCHDMEGQFWLQTDEGTTEPYDEPQSVEGATSLLELERRESGGIYDSQRTASRHRSTSRPPAPGVSSLAVARAHPLTNRLSVREEAVSSQQALVQSPLPQRHRHLGLVGNATTANDDDDDDDDMPARPKINGTHAKPSQQQQDEGEDEEEHDVAVPEENFPEGLECPTACLVAGTDMCARAKQACSVAEITQVPSSFLGCITDVCLKDDLSFVDMAIMDARITLMYNARHAQLKTEASLDKEEVAQMHLPTVMTCPQLSYGKEIWNLNPFTTSVDVWTPQSLTALCCGSELTRPEACNSFQEMCQHYQH